MAPAVNTSTKPVRADGRATPGCSGLRLLATLCLLALAVTAQRPPAPTTGSPTEPPAAGEVRIGLVLSGGGARGCAHVGVLQVLEELRVPVHCIAGTSMGSIVGGLYAYGLSPDQLAAEVVRTGDRRPWSVLLQDSSKRSARTFRRKQEDFELLVDVGLGLHDGELRMPKGLLQGQNLMLELLALTPRAHALRSFDELPLPYRAVAVALRTGEPVVLARGSLAEAMRASMSLPGIFAPAVVDGVELLDGGLVDNVPIAVARAMGATHVIVVDIGTPVEIDEVGSALDVSTQMVQILTQQNVDRSLATLEDGDVYIQPDLGDITSADFERADESIAIGAAAARAVAEQLRRHALAPEAYDRWRASQRRAVQPAPRIRRVLLDNRSGLGDALLRGRLRARPGDRLDLERLRVDLERIHGLGDFESVTFTIRAIEPRSVDVIVHAVDKSWGPTYLKFGLGLTTDLEGTSAFELGVQVNVREINALGAEWRTTATVGDRSSVLSEFYQPLTPDGRLFFAPRVSASNDEAASSIGTVDFRLHAIGVDLGCNIGSWGELRVGYSRLWGDVDPDFVIATQGFDFDDGVLEAQCIADTLDDASYPRSGVRTGLAYLYGDDAFGGEVEYQKLSGSGVGYTSVGRTTFGLGVAYETALAGTLPIYRTPALGGFSRLSGYDDNTVNGQHTGFVGVLVRHRLAGRHGDSFDFPVYVGATLETGNGWATRDDVWRRLRLAGSVFVSVNTPLGPCYLAYGQGEGGARSAYLYVGQPF
jgi:NTE family protein